jgi:hypothetical protein
MSMAGQGEISIVAQPSADIRNHRAVLFRTLGATCVHSLYRDGQHEAPLMEIVVAKHPVSFWQRFIHSASCSYEDLLRQHKQKTCLSVPSKYASHTSRSGICRARTQHYASQTASWATSELRWRRHLGISRSVRATHVDYQIVDHSLVNQSQLFRSKALMISNIVGMFVHQWHRYFKI